MDNQLQRQQYTLTNEIRLLEKKRTELLQGVERLDASKKEEYRQFSEEIKELTKRRDALMIQVQTVKEDLELLTQAYQTAKESISLYRKTSLSDAEAEANRLKDQARKEEKEAFDTKTHQEALLRGVLLREKAVGLEEERLKRERDELQMQLVDLDTRRKVDVEKHNESEEALGKLYDTIQALKKDIELLNVTKSDLNKYIAIKRGDIQMDLNEVKAKREELEQLILSTEQKHQVYLSQERQLKEDQLLLKDRQGQLDRAIDEFRKKGVVI